MHVIFVADESILPTDHGGRLAMANDVNALRAAGYTVSLVVPVDEPQPSDASGFYSYEFVSPVHFIPMRSADAAHRTHSGYPSLLGVRFPEDDDLRALRAFLDTQPIPTAVIATRETSLLLATWISESSHTPLVLRSHNDEISYWADVASDSTSQAEASRLRREAAKLRRRFRRLIAPVRAVALISSEDAPRYDKVHKSTRVVPALVAAPPDQSPPFDSRERLVSFVGSLTMPHTAAGLQWFIEAVWPTVLRRSPGARLVIAGRGASPSLQDHFDRTEGLSYLGRIDDVQALLDRARVFVNPVFKGSGISMKLAQPAASGLPVVATAFGLRGASEFADVVEASDDPSRLAQQISLLLDDGAEWERVSRRLREIMSSTYSLGGAAQAWKDVLSIDVPGQPPSGRITRRRYG